MTISLAETDTLAAIKDGDERAFERIFKQYYKGLCGYAIRMLQEQEGAEEIVQDMFCKLWESRETVNINTSLKSYLFRAVHNRCLNQIKHINIRENYKNHNQERIDHEEQHFSEHYEKFELQQQIEQAIQKLPTERQRIFRMSRFDGMKYREIADELGISIKTVEVQMGKALKTLRDDLSDYLPAAIAVIVAGGVLYHLLQLGTIIQILLWILRW